MRIKPKPGLKIRHPLTKLPIPAAGIEVADTDTFWTRRLADGDVVLAEPQQAPALADEQARPARTEE